MLNKCGRGGNKIYRFSRFLRHNFVDNCIFVKNLNIGLTSFMDDPRYLHETHLRCVRNARDKPITNNKRDGDATTISKEIVMIVKG